MKPKETDVDSEEEERRKWEQMLARAREEAKRNPKFLELVIKDYEEWKRRHDRRS